MKVVVIGATGATGKKLIKLLSNENKVLEIVALVARKNLEEHPKLTQIIVDFLDPESYNEYLSGANIAFSCMGTTLKTAGSKEAQWIVDYDYQLDFAKTAKANQVSCFVLLSAMNANTHAKSFYAQMKGKLEESIKVLNFENLIIAKPSLLIRPNSNRTLENIGVRLVRNLNRLGFLKKYRPLDVEDVAKAMMLSALRSQKALVELNVADIVEISS